MPQVMTYSGHTRAVLRLGLPLVGGHVAQVLVGVTDTVMLGWYSVDALAAVTLGSTFFFTLMIFGAGFAWAVMPLVASFAAEDDETGLRRATRMGLWLSLGFAVLAMPLMYWSEPVLRLMGQSDQVAADAGLYLRVAGFGIFPALIVMVLKSYLAALERTQVVFWITVAGAVVNGLANYALIFGNWGAPELGITGAAIASVVSQVAYLVLTVIYVRRSLPQHALFRRLWRADPQMLKRVFALGWPIGLTSLSETGLFAASALMMGWIGTVALAAHGIAVQLAAVTFMVHLGLSNAATIRAGNALGRRDPDHMERGGITVTVLSLITSALTIAVFVTFPEPLLNLFMQEDEPQRVAILSIGVGLLGMAALFQLVDGAQAIALGLLRGVQDTRAPMVFAAVSYWGLGIPCSYIFGFWFGMGGIGIWLGLVTGLGMAAILLSWRFWLVAMRDVRAGVPVAG
ncbi:MATE family efflux transporter [Roseobacter ponti]|uniref:Multidrug-efflux transporter n=1 Tax=Roseobacter ponti TaxID=1891787 RepID=A0A858SQ41_9RHOB|nr:MATE family efflux transporter [Roseobacter ponti]QJF50500.1 MATE family efflux transporter [Roseobacter ponti]